MLRMETQEGSCRVGGGVVLVLRLWGCLQTPVGRSLGVRLQRAVGGLPAACDPFNALWNFYLPLFQPSPHPPTTPSSPSAPTTCPGSCLTKMGFSSCISHSLGSWHLLTTLLSTTKEDATTKYISLVQPFRSAMLGKFLFPLPLPWSNLCFSFVCSKGMLYSPPWECWASALLSVPLPLVSILQVFPQSQDRLSGQVCWLHWFPVLSAYHWMYHGWDSTWAPWCVVLDPTAPTRVLCLWTDI